MSGRVMTAARVTVVPPQRCSAASPAVVAPGRRCCAGRPSFCRLRSLRRAAASEAPTTDERSAAEFFSADKRPIVLFDGVCNMCNGGVNFCLDWDKQGKVRFAALQSDVGRVLLQRCGRQPDDISSIVLVEEGACYIKSEAVLRIGQQMEMPLPILTTFAFPLPLFFRDTVYDVVAQNRYIVFGRTESCRLSDERFADRFVN